jgi:hypothetical protein
MAQANRHNTSNRPRCSSCVDPIFAAIEAHKAARAAFDRAFDLEKKFEESPLRRLPQVEVGAKYFVSWDSEIEELVRNAFRDMKSRFGKAFAAPLAGPLENVGKAISAALKADGRALKRAQDGAGWTKAKEQWESAKSAERFALLKLCETKPTTLDGLAALSDYFAELYTDQIEGGGNGESEIIFRAIGEAAKAMQAKSGLTSLPQNALGGSCETAHEALPRARQRSERVFVGDVRS